jgi:hypothetical protein
VKNRVYINYVFSFSFLIFFKGGSSYLIFLYKEIEAIETIYKFNCVVNNVVNLLYKREMDQA